MEMDLQEWDFVGDDFGYPSPRKGDQIGVLDEVDFNYFKCPSPTPNRASVAIPFQVEEKGLEKETVKEMIKVAVVNTQGEGDEELDSQQIFFKKNQFVDMKLEASDGDDRRINPETEAIPIQREEEKADKEGKEDEDGDVKEIIDEKRYLDSDVMANKSDWEQSFGAGDGDNGGGVSYSRWKMMGIGGLCSIGVAAATTMCILILGNRDRCSIDFQKNKKQEFRFQIYADDKRMKQVVHHATRLNQAISAVAGVPVAGAHITFGGYYDGF